MKIALVHDYLREYGGAERMVEAEKYCPDIIVQALSVTESLKSFNSIMLENHIREHVSHQVQKGEMEKAVRELIKIYKLNSK